MCIYAADSDGVFLPHYYKTRETSTSHSYDLNLDFLPSTSIRWILQLVLTMFAGLIRRWNIFPIIMNSAHVFRVCIQISKPLFPKPYCPSWCIYFQDLSPFALIVLSVSVREGGHLCCSFIAESNKHSIKLLRIGDAPPEIQFRLTT